MKIGVFIYLLSVFKLLRTLLPLWGHSKFIDSSPFLILQFAFFSKKVIIDRDDNEAKSTYYEDLSHSN